MARLAVRTGRLPSEWAGELERDERAVWTVLSLFEGDDRRAQEQEQDEAQDEG